MRWAHQTAIAIDQLVNALCGGYADETLSARAYRRQHASEKWRIIHRTIDGIFFWQDEHCARAWRNEVARKQLPSEYHDG